MPSFFRLLFFLSCLAFSGKGLAFAASWEWTGQQGREQLRIELDPSMVQRPVQRLGDKELFVPLSMSNNQALPQFLAVKQPADKALIERIFLKSTGLTVLLNTEAFGYIAKQEGKNALLLTVFPDALSSRLRSSTKPSAAARPAQAAPVQKQVQNQAQNQQNKEKPEQKTEQRLAPSAQQHSNNKESTKPQSVLPERQEASPYKPTEVYKPSEVPPLQKPEIRGNIQRNSTDKDSQGANISAPRQTSLQNDMPTQKRGDVPNFIPSEQSLHKLMQDIDAAQETSNPNNLPTQNPQGQNQQNQGQQNTSPGPQSENIFDYFADEASLYAYLDNIEPAAAPANNSEFRQSFSSAPTELPQAEDMPTAEESQALMAPLREVRGSLFAPSQEPVELAPGNVTAPPANASTNASAPSGNFSAPLGNLPASLGSAPAPSDNSPSSAPLDEQFTEPEQARSPMASQESSTALSQDGQVEAERSPLQARQEENLPPENLPSESFSQENLATGSNQPIPSASPSTEQNPNALRQSIPPRLPERERPPIDYVPLETEDVIYVDEEGNPVPAPINYADYIDQARNFINDENYEEALYILETLRSQELTPLQETTVLTLLSEAYYPLAQDNPETFFEPAIRVLQETINSDLTSVRVPENLARLGILHLKAGNTDAARGYFGALRTEYPSDPYVPEVFTLLGKNLLDQGAYAEASKHLQDVMEQYPQDPIVRQASQYLAQALYEQGYSGRALILLDFVERRWPRMHLDNPDYLPMLANVEFLENRYEDALDTYWQMINLLPEHPDIPTALFRIGSIYLQMGEKDAAKIVLSNLIDRFPEAPESPQALLRHIEEGIFDDEYSLEQLSALFANYPDSLGEKYKDFLKKYPKSPDAERVAARLVAWNYAQENYPEALKEAQAFLKKYPNSPNADLAKDVLALAFDNELEFAFEEEYFDHILSIWEQYPEAQEAYLPLDPSMRMALAYAHLRRGNEKEVLDLLAPFIDGEMHPQYGEFAYNTFLAKYLRDGEWENILELGDRALAWALPDSSRGQLLDAMAISTQNLGEEGQWQNILDLGDRALNWPLPEAAKGQLLYAMALSAQNVGDTDQAMSLWRELYPRTDLEPYQKAYAVYFMARDAENQRDLVNAYSYNLEALQLFSDLEKAASDKTEPERIKESLASLMDITEVAGRFAESMDWLNQYEELLPENSTEFGSLRFREARLERKMGNLAQWRLILEELISNEPDSVFGQMAASELRTQEVTRDLQRFTSGN